MYVIVIDNSNLKLWKSWLPIRIQSIALLKYVYSRINRLATITEVSNLLSLFRVELLFNDPFLLRAKFGPNTFHCKTFLLNMYVLVLDFGVLDSQFLKLFLFFMLLFLLLIELDSYSTTLTFLMTTSLSLISLSWYLPKTIQERSHFLH